MGNIFRHMTEKIRKYEQLKKDLPVVLGNQAVNFFQDSFRQGGFNEGTERWPEVKRRMPGTAEWKYPKGRKLARRTRAILVQTGTLRKDVKRGATSFNRTVIQTSVPYASYHNSGTRRIKRRKFMGRSEMLRQKKRSKIKYMLKKI